MQPAKFSASARPTVSAPTGGHLPPQALELEAAVLGAALLEAPAQRTLLATLPTEEVFYSAAHQQVYLAIRDLVQAGQQADLLTVVQQLRHRGTLERTGGPHFIAQLTQKVNSAAHLDSHCRILQEQHARRVVIRAGSELAAYGYDNTRDPLELLATAQTHLTTLNRTLETRPGQTAAAAFDATFDRLAQAVQQHGLTGIPTGLTQLDGLTGGWQPSDLIILAARPAMGKTAALLHFARTAARAGRPPPPPAAPPGPPPGASGPRPTPSRAPPAASPAPAPAYRPLAATPWPASGHTGPCPAASAAPFYLS
ncbi:hypothetical protein KBK19_03405 [Microvirga sp. STR05]|uniref:DNA 5'-3' helicase n=1 Tax=Hymenobacter duratus TaxID=2771356 RepID=A0ABR8JFC4_9BACT|nr:DnaB-like helicase N-terminal domain-containing protein [Hymenobacter duratus]MBD2714077.1 replicative DNA helicase [Hymenobacter duratus]MBR7948979.1 hypothetical protein [Microvirga sp. STR05]